VLQALIAKGNTERIKPETVPLDEKVVPGRGSRRRC